MTKPPTQRLKSNRKPYDPMDERAKRVADLIWEKAWAIAQILAPERPVGQEEMSEIDMFTVLAAVSTKMAPEFWNEPDAIMDFHRLLGKYQPSVPRDHLPVIAEAARVAKNNRPDPSITPENPEYEKMVRRVMRS